MWYNMQINFIINLNLSQHNHKMLCKRCLRLHVLQKQRNVNTLKANCFEKGMFALHDIFQELLMMDFISWLEFVPFCFEIICYLQKENNISIFI